MSKKKYPLYQNIITEVHGTVAVLILNHPQTMNALSRALLEDLKNALALVEKDPDIHVIVLTGNTKTFAAGADIKEFKDKSFPQVYNEDFITNYWDILNFLRKPIIAAVSGLALGGGCELAMMCDFIIAAENAQFGQPEIHLGTMPGAGGTQRLTRLVGKSKAMDMCLTGRLINATEAEQSGLVSRVFQLENFIDQVLEIAQHIAAMPQITVMMIKESINAAYNTPLSEGLRLERHLFYSTFATEYQKEGMKAFIEKRAPKFHSRSDPQHSKE